MLEQMPIPTQQGIHQCAIEVARTHLLAPVAGLILKRILLPGPQNVKDIDCRVPFTARSGNSKTSTNTMANVLRRMHVA